MVAMRRRWVTWVVAGLVMGAGVAGIYLAEFAYLREADEVLGLPPDAAIPLAGGLTQMDVLATLAPMAVWVLAVWHVARHARRPSGHPARVQELRHQDAL